MPIFSDPPYPLDRLLEGFASTSEHYQKIRIKSDRSEIEPTKVDAVQDILLTEEAMGGNPHA